MYGTIESLDRLIEKFASLPGVGKKTAERLAYGLIMSSSENVTAFSDAMLKAKENIHLCPVCQSLTDKELCSVCANEARDHSVICVVEDPKVVLSLEKVRQFSGVYHVLHGSISPTHGITPDKLKIDELTERVARGGIREVILATNATFSGDTTALYISQLLKDYDVKITRLAYGIPVGADLEYADSITLLKALEGRREF